MKALSILASGGWSARGIFALAALAAVAVQFLPVDVGAAPEREGPPPVPAAEGSAVRRPVFDPGRRPWTAQGSRDMILRADPVGAVLVLRGIRLDGTQARAFIDDGSGDKSWLAAGEGRGDWRLVTIGSDRVGVAQRGQRFEAEFLGHPAALRPIPFPDAPPALRP